MRRKRCPQCGRLFHSLRHHFLHCSVSNQSTTSSRIPHGTNLHQETLRECNVPVPPPVVTSVSVADINSYLSPFSSSTLHIDSQQYYQLSSTSLDHNYPVSEAKCVTSSVTANYATTDTITTNHNSADKATPTITSHGDIASQPGSASPPSGSSSTLPPNLNLTTTITSQLTPTVPSCTTGRCETIISADKSTSETKIPPRQHCGLSDVAKQNTFSSHCNNFLPRLRLPPASDVKMWSDVNDWVQSAVVPNVLEAVGVESKYQVIRERLYYGLKSRFGCHRSSTRKRKRKPANNQAQLDALRSTKNEVRRKFRQAKRQGASLAELTSFARQFHQLIRRHSKLKAVMNKRDLKSSARNANKRCSTNFWKFSKDLFSDDSDTSNVLPQFSADEAYTFFQSTYSKQSLPPPPVLPSGVSSPQPPSHDFDIRPFSTSEILKKIKSTRNSAAPSPLDGLSYLVFKMCPSLLPALLDLFNCCWLSASIPQLWKTGVIRLFAKPAASKDPHDPSLFRPIALTPCIGKIYTSMLKDRWCQFMLENKFFDTSIQKAFLPGICGTEEHQYKLRSAIADAKRSRHALSICWLDFANAYGSVPHWLILQCFRLYHAPDHLLSVITNIYSNLQLQVSTVKWATSMLPCNIGVLQGDPFSVIVFNTVINTLVMMLKTQPFGYTLSGSSHKINAFLFADDVTLVSKSPSGLQRLCNIVSDWCQWSQLTIKMSKSSCLGLSFKPKFHLRDPSVSISNESVPFLGSESFLFLGMPINGNLSDDNFKSSLISKAKTLMEKLDNCPVSCRWKLKLYQNGIFPRLSWYLSLLPLSPSWLQSELDRIVTSYLKKWCKLRRSACTAIFYLLPQNAGLGLPRLSTSSISLQSSKSARLLSSHDNCVRSLATSQAYNKSYSNRFSAFREAAKSLSETPGASAAKLSDITKSRLKEEHQKQLLARTKNLHVQGSIFRLENCSSDVWANVVSCLPGHQLSFVLNAVSDTLPSNANLVLWSKRSCDKCPLCHQRQTLLHVLNNCSVLLQCRHYNQRHDSVLSLLYNAAINHLPHQFQHLC